eukprot:CAMPEP_0176028252 /NCGR_PEP_ID=MMETSP0120_2-20121206/13864_1 /TAXON_ID=160619 /ORGANISM="Kryptoperidinium foliaceum, Strain CCMP 1326" /LENGTH=71 /DNA_ID=CAMNT_0017361461 /DNA_START=54 /DNA_END=265 /DNA_ORIENTATION=-
MLRQEVVGPPPIQVDAAAGAPYVRGCGHFDSHLTQVADVRVEAEAFRGMKSQHCDHSSGASGAAHPDEDIA